MTDGVRLLWSAAYHDGPVSGVAELDGEQVWFEARWDDEAEEWPSPSERECWLYRLTSAELGQLWLDHELFERAVSTRGCYHLPDEARTVRDRPTHALYYERSPAIQGFTPKDETSLGSFRLLHVWAPPSVGGGLDSVR